MRPREGLTAGRDGHIGDEDGWFSYLYAAFVSGLKGRPCPVSGMFCLHRGRFLCGFMTCFCAGVLDLIVASALYRICNLHHINPAVEGVAELAEEVFMCGNLSPLLSKEGLGVVSHSLLSKAMIFI